MLSVYRRDGTGFGLLLRGMLGAGFGVVACAIASGVSGNAALAYQLYPTQELQKDADRLATAVRKIYRLGVLPVLTAREKKRLATVRFSFPMPDAGGPSAPLDFYASRGPRGNFVVFPVHSMKVVEDLTLAYAYTLMRGEKPDPIDIYFAAIANQPPGNFPSGNPPDLLTALGIPKDAYKLPGVDKTSLALRNEAFAFILVHELGHIFYRHRGVGQLTAKQARADEVQSDQFALDVLARTGTPPLGALFYFQAQIYALPHRAIYPSRELWDAYVSSAMTHPLSTDRIRAMGRTMAGPIARSRPKEARRWREIAQLTGKIVRILDDRAIHRCISEVAREIPMSALRLGSVGHKRLLTALVCDPRSANAGPGDRSGR